MINIKAFIVVIQSELEIITSIINTHTIIKFKIVKKDILINDCISITEQFVIK